MVESPEFSRPSPLGTYDFSSEKARILGVTKSGQTFTLDFFDREISLSAHGIQNKDITPAIQNLLIQYLLNCPKSTPSPTQRLVTFREFSGAAPLISRFTSNTAKIIETSFSGKLSPLRQRCLDLGGSPVESGGYDLSFRFRALARIPVIFNFNDQDEMMPPSASFLYHDNANQFLDLKSLMATCTYLTGLLIRP